MKFANVKLEDLQIAHSEMCATAGDLGIKVPSNLTTDFDSEVEGVPICEKLHALIEEHRKALASAEGKAQGGPKSRDVSSGPETTKKMAAQKAARLAKGNPAPANKAPAKKAGAAKGEATVAKKAAKKKVPVKAAKKKAASNGATRSKFDENSKVTFIAKENPAREGSARWDRYEKLRKNSGKTVGAMIKAGVPTSTLANASASKTIKIG